MPVFVVKSKKHICSSEDMQEQTVKGKIQI